MRKYKKKIYWSKMTEEERLNKMRRVAKKECLVDGVLLLSRSHRLLKAMEEYRVTADELIEGTGLKRFMQVQIHWRSMPSVERLKRMRQLAKEEYIVDGIFYPQRSGKKLSEVMKTYNISVEELLEGMNVKRNLNHEESRNALSLKLERLYSTNSLREKVLNSAAEANTLGELIATLLYDKKGTLKKIIESRFTGKLKAVDVANKFARLLDFAEEPLDKLTKDKYLKILHFSTEKLSIPPSSDAELNRRISKLLFRSAAQSGLFIPAGLEYGFGSYTTEFIEAERKGIKKPNTVYEHCIKIFPDGELKLKAKVLIALKKTASVSPEHYGIVLTRKGLDGESKQTRSTIIQGINKILVSLKDTGIVFGVPLSDTNREYGIELPYLQHLLTKNNVSKKDRTFSWYVFEALELHKQWGKRELKVHTYKAYKDYFETKLIEMTRNDFLKIRSGTERRPRFMDIVRKIHEEGMYSKDVLADLEKDEMSELDFDAPAWRLSSGTNMNFGLIDERYRDTIKHYVKYLEQNKKTTRPDKLYTMNKFFKVCNMPKFDALNRDAEMIYYATLQNSITNDQSRRKARGSLRQFRSIVGNLNKLGRGLVPKNYKLNYDFKINVPKPKIMTFNEDEQHSIIEFLQKSPSETNKYMTRLQLCAFGIQILSARRLSEVFSKRKDCGLKINAISNWGMSGEKLLRYFRDKSPSGEKIVLFSDMIGERSDPFAKAIPELLPKLFEEAKEITSSYRHSLPDNLKEYLFVIKTSGTCGISDLYNKMGEGFIYTKLKRLYKDIGIDTAKTSHVARHTMATSLILAGGTVADAADALGDETRTISRYYHEYTSRQDTMKLLADRGRTQMVDSLEDSARFKKIEAGKHRVCSPEEMSPHGHKMVGGSCTHTVEGRLNCKSYQMVRGAKSCPGCEFFEISTVDNKSYWETELKASLQNMEATDPSSPAFLYEDLNHKVAENMLKEIEEKELEAEWEF